MKRSPYPKLTNPHGSYHDPLSIHPPTKPQTPTLIRWIPIYLSIFLIPLFNPSAAVHVGDDDGGGEILLEKFKPYT